jgi:SAM-dependent methyltransferase
VSFRDPDGFVFRSGDQILRCVLPHAADDLRAFLSSPTANAWMASGVLSQATLLPMKPVVEPPPTDLSDLPAEAVFLEHEPIRFPNYPYEWSAEMLYAAAVLTLRLAEEGLNEGFTLKDATPYNIMFDGPRAVFLDVLSFRRWDPLEMIWWPYAQFVRTFVYPLLVARHFGLHLDEVFLPHRDGLEPERVMRFCSPMRRWLPRFFGAVTLPVLLSRAERDGNPSRFRSHRARDSQEAKFVLHRVFARANRLLGSPRFPVRTNAAACYMDCGLPYTELQVLKKEQAVSDALRRYRPASVLDIGCNTGHFSLLASQYAPFVVAIDQDPGVVGILWRSASQRKANILPLVIDIARPPGACGWANQECLSFLDRARGKFECVLMLALIHHLLAHERVPLDNILELAAQMTRDLLIMEYIDPTDLQFQRIARGREPVHPNLTRGAFEDAVARRSDIAECCELTPTRRIYVLRKRGA